jgi:hypothetical protein
MKIKIVMTHYFVKPEFTAARRPRVRWWDNEDMTGERLEVRREIAWTVVGQVKPPIGHVCGYLLEPAGDSRTDPSGTRNPPGTTATAKPYNASRDGRG